MILTTLLSKRLKFLLLCAAFFSGCSDGQEKIADKYELVDYYPEIFVSMDYIFNNEGLNKPWQIKENPNGEIVLLDAGNVVFYVFSPEGKFLRMFSRVGQGPGEILEPRYFDIDQDGDIYVYEYGNQRISILNKEGKHLNSFRIKGARRETRIYVNKNKEILVNLPGSRDFYITVFSRNGEILREIGRIPSEIKQMEEYWVGAAAFAYPFMDNRGNYYVFLERLLTVQVYNEEGILINERPLDELVDSPALGEGFVPPFKQKDQSSMIFREFLQDIIFKNNRFYLLSHIAHTIPDYKNEIKTLYVYVVNLDLQLLKNINLPLENSIDLTGSFELRFDVLESEKTIILPLVKSSEILKFTESK